MPLILRAHFSKISTLLKILLKALALNARMIENSTTGRAVPTP
jgi:hypothetical protein